MSQQILSLQSFCIRVGVLEKVEKSNANEVTHAKSRGDGDKERLEEQNESHKSDDTASSPVHCESHVEESCAVAEAKGESVSVFDVVTISKLKTFIPY